MMRRCVRLFAAATTLNANRPIFEVMMKAQPEGTGDWGKQTALLHRHHVHTAGCWHALNADQKRELIEEGLSADIVDALNRVVEEGLGEPVKKVLILYGSQTGTAENFARMLGTYATGHGFVPVLTTMNDGVNYLKNATQLPKALIFVTSTYGVGEFPSNAEIFYQELAAHRLPQATKIPYAILGLGNSYNERFNAAAKNLDKKLKELGGKSFLRTQLSCELSPGHDTVYRNWKRGIWAALDTANKNAAPRCSYQVKDTYQKARPDPTLVPRSFMKGTVHQNELVTPQGYDHKVHHLTFQVPMRDQIEKLGRRVTFNDHVLVYPKNSDELVARAAKRFNLDLEKVVEVSPLFGAQASHIDGHKMTLKTLLQEVVDLSAIPSRSVLEIFACITTDQAERKALDDLANDLSAGSEYEKLSTGIFSIMDVFERFPKLQLSLDQLVSYTPHIAPRTYSLARDNADWNRDEFELVYTVPHKAVNGKTHDGLCSSMLSRLTAGDELLVKFVPSGVTLPQLQNPVCFVALGTGIGSVRSMLQNRRIAKRNGATVGPAVLYYGSRNAGKDQLFKAELEEMEKEGLVELRYTASHDQPEFKTPMSRMDASLADFLGAKGEVVYCGLGGSVPLIVDSELRKNGVDVAALRATGRYHEEYFTADSDTENLLKAARGDTSAKTLAARVGKCDMFCMQCEQTFKGTGCVKVGVCGKTPRVAALQDLAVHATKIIGFYATGIRENGGKVSDAVNRLTLYGLFTTLTNVNFSEERFVDLLQQLNAAIKETKAGYEKVCKKKNAKPEKIENIFPDTLPDVDGLVELGRTVGVLTRFGDEKTQSGAGVNEMLTYGLKGIAAYTDHSLMNKKENPEIYAFIHRALAHLAGDDKVDLKTGLGLCLEAGKINVASMSLLYDSNATLGTPTPTSVPVKPVPGKCILVSGHDLIILKKLLEVTEPLGINVYTHGEMLPAHSYPSLKKHKNLIGNFGGAWMRQAVEFPHFPGPVLMTTNCLTEPHESYKCRLFTAGAVGWSGVPHVGDTLDTISFDDVIRAANEEKGFTDADKEFSYEDPVGYVRPASFTVGFGHKTIIGAAPTILDQIKKGNITRFYLVGGCDGYEGQRNYFTELVKKLPKTAVVLTVGCGKYRFNHLDLGTIGDTGIPRILDMGQCNDSFSAVQVALALADALKCKVTDLPLSIALSWFEQKAVAVLLSCLSLGLKTIHLGPTPPAFITPEVLEVLVKDFGLKLCADPEKDLEAMLNAKGMIEQ